MFLTIDGDHGGEPTGSMRPVFVARGPAFKKNYTTLKSTTVNSVDIYNLMCFILDLVPGPNNGSFEKQNFKDKFSYEFIYPTTHDAILNICFNRKVSSIDSAQSLNAEFNQDIIKNDIFENSIENSTHL